MIYECICRCLCDVAIIVHGYEQDGGVSIAVLCTLASVQKEGSLAI